MDALDTLVPSAVTKAAKDEERYDLPKGQICPEQPGLVSKRAVFKDKKYFSILALNAPS